jgi:hypothetical protein
MQKERAASMIESRMLMVCELAGRRYRSGWRSDEARLLSSILRLVEAEAEAGEKRMTALLADSVIRRVWKQ